MQRRAAAAAPRTLWPGRPDGGRSAGRMWDVEACVIPLFSFHPQLSSRAAVCGPPGGTRSSGSCSVVVATPGRGLDALRSIALHKAEDAEARAEALLGMRLRLHDRLEQRDRGGADLLGLAQHACRRPFRVTPMARRHVLRDRR